MICIVSSCTFYCVFFFKQKTAYEMRISDWSSDVCSSDLIPLGIAKAVRDGSRFDILSSGVIIVGYAIPSFLFAVLLIIVFASGPSLSWFPLRGLFSPGVAQLPSYAQVGDSFRSEERRVGNECVSTGRSRCLPDHSIKKTII